jgi:hypothetical protein
MNATHNHLFNSKKSNKGFFLYYISYKENKYWENFLNYEKIVTLLFSLFTSWNWKIPGCDRRGGEENIKESDMWVHSLVVGI